MARYFADLHVHSALSPCADPDMTPANIAAMAALKGLDVVALCDHNSAFNAPSFAKACAEYDILAVPAMEVTVREEAHVLCYFRRAEDALSYAEYLYGRLPYIAVDLGFFSSQTVFDEQDEIIACKDKLLISAVDIGVDELYDDVARGLDGAVVPAHVDRKSYSLIASLGFIPPSLPVHTLELSHQADWQQWRKNRLYMGYQFTASSDAHSLGDILEQKFSLELEQKSLECVINWLKN